MTENEESAVIVMRGLAQLLLALAHAIECAEEDQAEELLDMIREGVGLCEQAGIELTV